MKVLSSPCQPAEQVQRYRVLFLIDRLSEMGGAELALARLVRELSAQGASLHVITFSEDICDELHALFPCAIQVLSLRRTYDYQALQVAWKIRSEIVRKKIHLVHTFFETSDLFGGLITRSVPGVALVTSRRDMGILRRRRHRLAYPILGRLAHRVVTVSDKVRDWCIEADGLPGSRVLTVYNGVKAAPGATPAEGDSSRSTIRAELGLSSEQVVIVAVGNIRHVKGYDVLIEAAALVLRDFPETVFLVAGAEHEEGGLRRLQVLAEDQKIQGAIRFLGQVREIPSLLRATEIFLLPSRSEGFSNALIEAMSAGLPCIATSVGGNAEAVHHGVSGLIVSPEDPAGMSRALLHLIASADLRRKMGEEGRRIVERRFTHAAMIANMLAVYRSALSDVGYPCMERSGDA